MSDDLFGLVELGLFLGAPLAWAIWELWRLRREQARDAQRAAEQPPPGADAPRRRR